MIMIVVAIIVYRVIMDIDFCPSMTNSQCFLVTTVVSSIFNAMSILILGKVSDHCLHMFAISLLPFICVNIIITAVYLLTVLLLCLCVSTVSLLLFMCQQYHCYGLCKLTLSLLLFIVSFFLLSLLFSIVLYDCFIYFCHETSLFCFVYEQ